MKTAISIPDSIYEDAERLAKQLAKSRSQLYTDAVSEYLLRHRPESVTERLNEVYDAASEPEDQFVSATVRHVLSKVEW